MVLNFNPGALILESYSDIIATFGEILVEETAGSGYEGTIYACVLNRDTNKYGYIMQAYGSCAGCDLLEGSGPEMTREAIGEEIEWFDTLQELREFVNKAAEESDWYTEETTVFRRRLLDLDFDARAQN
jgi:hypothetical protein